MSDLKEKKKKKTKYDLGVEKKINSSLYNGKRKMRIIKKK